MAQPEPVSLCSNCQAAIDSWNSLETYSSKDGSFKYCAPYILVETALAGCPLCLLFWNQLDDSDQNKLRAANIQNTPASQSLVYVRSFFMIYLELPVLELRVRFPAVKLYPHAKGIVPSGMVQGRTHADSTLETCTGSTNVLRLAAKWLENCVENHHGCHSFSKFIPTRLIDIGAETLITPRLVLGTSILPGTRYVTLSHCCKFFIGSRNIPFTLRMRLRSTFCYNVVCPTLDNNLHMQHFYITC